MTFYENYVSLCNRIGKAPSAVALEIGLSKPAVFRWKNGGTPTDATAKKVADYFGVTVERLFSENGYDLQLFANKEDQEKTPTSAGERNYEDMELLAAFRNADESTKAAIRLLLKVE